MEGSMQKKDRLLFLLLCSGVSLIVVFLSRQSHVVFSTKPFQTFALHQGDDASRGERAIGSATGPKAKKEAKNHKSHQIGSPQTRERSVRVQSVACVPPQIHPFDPSLLDVLESYSPLNCTGGLPSIVTHSVKGDNLLLKVDPDLVRQKLGRSEIPVCRYKAISVTPGGDFNTTSSAWSESFTNSIIVGAGQEHFVVECHHSKDHTPPLLAKSYISVARERADLEDELRERRETHLQENAPLETLSVIIVGIDGMSKQNMVRTLPKTRDFLLRKLHAKEMLNYNKNGMNTFPNVITLLTGKTVSEISAQHNWSTSKFFDSVPFVWDEFAHAGYRTQVALDSSRVTSFHCSKKGFSRPPVHYYHRPLVLHSELDSDVRHKDGNCIGDTPEVTLLLDYVLQMASTFGASTKFPTSDTTRGKSTRESEHRSETSRLKRSVSSQDTSMGKGDENVSDSRGKIQHTSSTHWLGNTKNLDNPEEVEDIQDLHERGQRLQQKQQSHKEQQNQQQNLQEQPKYKQNREQRKQEEKQNQQQYQQEQEQPPPRKQQQHRLMRPFFSYNFLVRLTHDNTQKASLGDLMYVEFFRSMQATGALNSSILIFFSDHGPRFGPLRRTLVGTMEDRMPFCLLVFPPWFLRKYPDVDRALTTNQNRLTSHFDIHATLRDILHFQGGGTSNSERPASQTLYGGGKNNRGKLLRTQILNDGASQKIEKANDPNSTDSGSAQDSTRRHSAAPPRGLSLLREIPRDRTCRAAGIDFQWCSCNRLAPVDSHDALVRLLALEFALILSDKTARARQVCHQLNLASVRSAPKVTLEGDVTLEVPRENSTADASASGTRFSKLLSPANTTRKDLNLYPHHSRENSAVYLLSIETKPGGGVFEGHLEFSQTEGSVRLLGTVLRLNMFQGQSMCVEEPGLKPFCYCKDLNDSTAV